VASPFQVAARLAALRRQLVDRGDLSGLRQTYIKAVVAAGVSGNNSGIGAGSAVGVIVLGLTAIFTANQSAASHSSRTEC